MNARYIRLHRALDHALDEAEFKESDHPRAENGQFGKGGGSSSPGEIPKPPKNTLQLKRLYEWAKEGKLKSIEKSIELQDKEISNSSISSNDKAWRTQVKSYAEELRKSLGGSTKSTATATPVKSAKSASHEVSSMSAASPGEPVAMNSASKMVKLEKGTPLYHASQDNLKRLKDQPMWFTPFQDEAKAYYQNTKDDFGHAASFEVPWDGSKIASEDQAAAVAKEIWPDNDFSYSMLDEAVDEYDKRDVRKFIATLAERGFAGSVATDYSAIGNRSRDSNTVCVFHPNEHVNMKESKKALMLDAVSSGRSARLHRALNYALDSVGYK